MDINIVLKLTPRRLASDGEAVIDIHEENLTEDKLALMLDYLDTAARRLLRPTEHKSDGKTGAIGL